MPTVAVGTAAFAGVTHTVTRRVVVTTNLIRVRFTVQAPRSQSARCDLEDYTVLTVDRDRKLSARSVPHADAHIAADLPRRTVGVLSRISDTPMPTSLRLRVTAEQTAESDFRG